MKMKYMNKSRHTLWHHQIEIFSELLALWCSFVFSLNKHSTDWKSEKPWQMIIWRPCNELIENKCYTRHHRTWSILVQAMACHLSGAIPLPEPMLAFTVNWTPQNKQQWNLNPNQKYQKIGFEVWFAKQGWFCSSLNMLMQVVSWDSRKCENLTNQDFLCWTEYI